MKLARSILALLLLLALPVVAYAAHDAVATGKAQMHPESQSGVKGRINFVDDGSTLEVSGTASGLDPSGIYVSLIYDNKSVPGGPLACEPAIFDPEDPDYILDTMFVGFWSVEANGNGTLSETNIVEGEDVFGPRVYVPLDKFRTISIRRIVSFDPFDVPVVACGWVADHPAGN